MLLRKGSGAKRNEFREAKRGGMTATRRETRGATMIISAGAEKVVRRLRAGGYRAYLVGGCVRDALLGKEPVDWDVATSARPEQVTDCFGDLPVIPTGLKHGTVTVLSEHMPVEVTTFRKDGAYLDNRRPSEVFFVDDLKEDLSRRDFTINALAYAPEEGLIDCFGGAEDLKAGVIRTVGSPDERFGEDDLRILRALRFASTLGFRIDDRLSAGIHGNRNLLTRIAAERIAAELMKLLPGVRIFEILMEYADVFAVFIPEITPATGFDQRNPHHAYDVWEHTAVAISQATEDPIVRLALLFHDLGKPASFLVGEDGVGHFYGHEARGAAIAHHRLRKLRFDKDTVETVTALIKWHDAVIAPNRLLKWLSRLSPERLRLLFAVKRADGLAHTEMFQDARVRETETLERALDRILEEKTCYTLKDLAVNGKDLIDLGVPKGPRIGDILHALLDDVTEGKRPNERGALLSAAARLIDAGPPT
ncbi:MAG: HD domain-containing protein [Clostridiales Family XIII bacterium]|jgi:tRNA nucleotidyltransferase (CCA-adding enzyme)|nr:HD domain-containing protein [Clostridiales Family XIII bacterium]